jgi:hypothetical protein
VVEQWEGGEMCAVRVGDFVNDLLDQQFENGKQFEQFLMKFSRIYYKTNLKHRKIKQLD